MYLSYVSKLRIRIAGLLAQVVESPRLSCGAHSILREPNRLPPKPTRRLKRACSYNLGYSEMWPQIYIFFGIYATLKQPLTCWATLPANIFQIPPVDICRIYTAEAIITCQ